MTRQWSLAHGRRLELGNTGHLMGVLNVTPDSFSDGGDHVELEAALKGARAMMNAGASIIDVGGESTRPGAEPVSGETERARILPVIEALAKSADRPLISVDTYRADTAFPAIQLGAHVLNDIWGLQRDAALASIAAETGAGLILMHNSRDRDVLADPIEDQMAFFDRSLVVARKAGVRDDQIVLDPGFGFGKDVQDNIRLARRVNELDAIGFPILVGLSRKRVLGAITGHDDPKARDIATAATTALMRLKGASIFRVHNVAANRDALAVADALLAEHPGELA